MVSSRQSEKLEIVVQLHVTPPEELERNQPSPLKSYNMDKVVEKINKWFRDNYNIKVDYSTMTITLKKKNNESKKCVTSTNS